MKTILECAERMLSVILSVSSCMGMFLIGCFGCNLLIAEVTTETMWIIFLVSLILTYILIQLLLAVRYRRLEILAEELQMQKDEEAQKLYEHLTQNTQKGVAP